MEIENVLDDTTEDFSPIKLENHNNELDSFKNRFRMNLVKCNPYVLAHRLIGFINMIVALP